MAKSNRNQQMPSKAAKRGTTSGPRVEQLVVRARIAIVDELLKLLQAIEPETNESLDQRRKAAAKDKKGSHARRSLAHHLRFRSRHAKQIRAAIRGNWRFVQSLETAFLPDRGIVGQDCKPVSDRRWDTGPEPPQQHVNRSTFVGWHDTVFGCAARCSVAGAECVEPAILAAIKILRTLRELVPEDETPTTELAKVFDQRGNLRAPVRQLLKALDLPARKLDELAKRLGCDEVYVRKFSKPLQNAGLVRQQSDGSWARTQEGSELLKR